MKLQDSRQRMEAELVTMLSDGELYAGGMPGMPGRDSEPEEPEPDAEPEEDEQPPQ